MLLVSMAADPLLELQMITAQKYDDPYTCVTAAPDCCETQLSAHQIYTDCRNRFMAPYAITTSNYRDRRNTDCILDACWLL